MGSEAWHSGRCHLQQGVVALIHTIYVHALNWHKVYDLQLASLLANQSTTREHVNLSQPQMASGSFDSNAAIRATSHDHSCLGDATDTNDDLLTMTCNMRVSQFELICAMHPSLLM